MAPQNFACQREDGMHAVECGFFVAVFRDEVLGRHPGKQLDVEFPSGGAVRVLWGELALGKTEIDLKAGEAPFLQKVASLNGKYFDLEMRR
jgi:hypothetical protein